jgi:hypothetical protein
VTRCGAAWAAVLLVPAAVVWVVVQFAVNAAIDRRRRRERGTT